MKSQLAELQKGCDILVASPGRLQDFARRAAVSFSRVRFVVLDEADRMIAMGQDIVKWATITKAGFEFQLIGLQRPSFK